MNTNTFNCASCGAALPSADTYHPYDACLRTEELRAENERLRDERDGFRDRADGAYRQQGEYLLEVERLKADYERNAEAYGRRLTEADHLSAQCRDALDASRAENSRLREERDKWIEANAVLVERLVEADTSNERLRAALEQIAPYPHIAGQIARATLDRDKRQP